MKKLFTKLCLLGVFCLIGGNAWGEDAKTATIYARAITADAEKGISAWSADDISSSVVELKWTPNWSDSNSKTFYSAENGLGTVIRGKSTLISTLKLSNVNFSIVTIDAVFNTGSSTFPANENASKFQYGSFIFENFTRYNGTAVYVNGTKYSLSNTANNTDVSIHLKVNSVTGGILEATVSVGTTQMFSMTNLGDNTTMDVGTEYDKVKCIAVNNVSSNTTTNYVKSLKIQYTEQEVQTAKYNVEWINSANPERKLKSEEREGKVGDQIALNSADKNSFFDSEDDTKKYIYASDDVEGKTIAADGSSVVTITMRDAVKYSYSVTTSYNGVALAYTASGSTWEDVPNVTISYPRFQAAGATGNILVERAPVSNELKTTINVSEDNYTTDLVYSATGIENLYLLSEAENLGTGLSTNGTSFTDRVSNRAIIYGASGTLLTLPAGTFKFTLGVIGGDNSTHKVNYVVYAGEETIIEATCNGNMLNCATSEEFTLTEPTAITFTCSDPSSSRGIDLVYVQKIIPNNWTASVPTAGMTTFCSPYNLDFSETSIKAYKGVVNGEKVTLEEVDKVPAGVGVLLVAEGGTEENIPVAAEAEALTGNQFVGVLENTEINSSTPGTNYVLAYDATSAETIANTIGFYYIGSTQATVTAGKAYLNVPASGASTRLTLDFGDVTGINAIETVKTVEAGATFNLSGQRVNDNYKGVVIKNGVKYFSK